ncbi:MAG: LLM class flavin-dependent oxidoreductase [Acidimicrobiia bacterium]
MRFDLRNPSFSGVSMSDRYSAALDMCEWADEMGFVQVGLSEHHASDDGYLPSPVPFMAAMATRTKRCRIGVAALIAPFYDPIKLAEDLAVADLISHGRIDLTVANGYVAGEFDMFGVDMKRRARLTEEMIVTLKKAWTGEPFEFRGRTVQVRPTPAQPGGPRITLGGSSEPAARRAARIADGFAPSNPEVWEFYRDEMAKLGKPDPGPGMPSGFMFTHLAKDVEAGWKAVLPHAMHETNAYGKWLTDAGLGVQGGLKPVTDPDDIKTGTTYRVITPEQLVAELKAMGDFGFALLHPLMGGIPPEVAWSSLKLLETEVIPNL